MIRYIKKDDTKPYVKAVLKQVTDDAPAGEAVDLTGASVKFIMRKSGASTAKVDASADIVDASNGKVRYTWSTGDTDTEGDYVAEFQVTDSGSDITTFWDMRTPQDIIDNLPPDPLIIRIISDLD